MFVILVAGRLKNRKCILDPTALRKAKVFTILVILSAVGLIENQCSRYNKRALRP